jgi:hypothetical protein
MPGRTGGQVISAPCFKHNEGHVFYLAFGYFISYLPYALLAKALSSGIIPGVDRPAGGQLIAVTFIVGAVAARSYPAPSAMAECIARVAMATTRSGHLTQQAVRTRLAEQFL